MIKIVRVVDEDKCRKYGFHNMVRFNGEIVNKCSILHFITMENGYLLFVPKYCTKLVIRRVKKC